MCWAATLLQEVLRRLREEAVASEGQALFEKLKDHLWGETAEGLAGQYLETCVGDTFKPWEG